MPQADLLSIKKLESFKRWLTAQGHEHRPGKGHHQVLQVRLVGDPVWHVVYYRDANPEHYSVPWPLCGVVERFIGAHKKAKKWTAVLVRSQDAADALDPDSDHRHVADRVYVALVEGDNVVEAVGAAKQEALDADKRDLASNDDADKDFVFELEDYSLVVLFGGHHSPSLFGFQAH